MSALTPNIMIVPMYAIRILQVSLVSLEDRPRVDAFDADLHFTLVSSLFDPKSIQYVRLLIVFHLKVRLLTLFVAFLARNV